MALPFTHLHRRGKSFSFFTGDSIHDNRRIPRSIRHSQLRDQDRLRDGMYPQDQKNCNHLDTIKKKSLDLIAVLWYTSYTFKRIIKEDKLCFAKIVVKK